MSGAPSDLDIREQIVRIDRASVETQKLSDAARKFSAEQFELQAEQFRLQAETMKLNRDRRLAPWAVLASLITSIIALALTLARYLPHGP